VGPWMTGTKAGLVLLSFCMVMGFALFNAFRALTSLTSLCVFHQNFCLVFEHICNC
jgi:hypothetical protein